LFSEHERENGCVLFRRKLLYDYPMGARSLETQVRRYERDAQRRQRELERRAKEQAKLSAIEQAKLEVESYENRLEVLLSVHKEQGKRSDWLEVLASLPPPVPERLTFFELRSQQQVLTLRPEGIEAAEDLVAQGRQQDDEAYTEASRLYLEHVAEGNELRSLARRILNGEHKSYTDALVRFSPLGELADLGSAIHFTVHDATLIECGLTLNGQQVIPKEIKALTASEKLSVKPMPKGRFQEIYEDHICGCVLRVAREVFALLPVRRLLITARAVAVDMATGRDQEKPVLSVIFQRDATSALDFDRLDPSEAVKGFPHRAHFKGTRKSEAFEAIKPFIAADVPRQDADDAPFRTLVEKMSSTMENLKTEISKLKKQPIVPAQEINTVL
jgi:hypothetical protein